MRFYTRKRRTPSIIIVSLIDILAILLIFFIVTTTFNKQQPQMQIKLPEATTAEEASPGKNDPLVLRVKSEDEIMLGDKKVPLDQLTDALKSALAQSPNRPLTMQADKEAPFGVVVKVMDALKLAGIKNVNASTQPQSK